MSLSPFTSCAVPSMQIPSFRTSLAVERGVEKNLLLRTWGGLGDQICAEPTLRYAIKNFPTCDISLASEAPQLFEHLNFKKVYNLKKEKPNYDEYFLFDTIVPPAFLTWEFFSHCITNCVDFPSLCAFRCQLPIAEKEIVLKPVASEQVQKLLPAGSKAVVIHAGRHWPSKTFPKDWWDEIIAGLIADRVHPILIGADTDDNRGTVDVDTSGCIDLRNVLSITESIWLVQRAAVLLTNDSSPLHMAASRNPDDPATGNTHIGYVATCKHPDYITHWRRGQWNFRETNLGLGGMWDLMDHCPNKENEITVDKIDADTLRSWLPSPGSVVDWTRARLLGGDAPGLYA